MNAHPHPYSVNKPLAFMRLQKDHVAEVLFLIRLSRRVVSGKELGPNTSGVSVRLARVSGVSELPVEGHTHEITVRTEGEIACKVMEESFASIYKNLAAFRRSMALDSTLGSMEGAECSRGLRNLNIGIRRCSLNC